MSHIKIIFVSLILTSTLSGCYTMAVGTAGAGAGYIIKEKEDESDGDLD